MAAVRTRRVPSATAAAVVTRFPRVRVLVAGDLMLDHFIWGRVERISPEAPVPVVQVTAESRRLGGAANVAHNLRALGGEVTVCGVVGGDAAGRDLLDELRRIGADVRGVVQSRGAATTRKTRIIAHQQQVVRLDREDGGQGDSRAAARARGFLLAQLRAFDVVLISDYGKGFITAPLLAALAGLRAQRPFPLLIDPKQVNYPHYRGASLLTPNQSEASQAAGIEIRDAASLRRAGAELLRRWQAEAVLITRGEHGMSLFAAQAPERHFPTVARHVYDVTGAGDTVVAACALALGAGASLEAAAVLANHAAGIVVGEVGTATVTAAELKADLRVRRTTPPSRSGRANQ
ncbi:MAG: D-glycero-beta-D-manno-heptose-7-phosphate kinase [Candidatus Binatia bacterium]